MQASPERIVWTRIHAEMERLLQDQGAPEDIHAFMLQHWARLMTHIFMAKGNRDPDWQAGWDTLNALLWSLAPKQGRSEAALLLRALPNLLARLQAGLEALAVPVRERDIFFQRLAVLHAAITHAGMQPGSASPAGQESPSLATALEDQDVDLATLVTPSSHTDPPLPSTGVDGRAVPELQVGNHILLRVEGEDRRMYLKWLSPMRGMYLFVSDDDAGALTLTLTRTRLTARFQQGEASLLPKV